MRVEGAIFLSHLQNPSVTARAMKNFGGYVFVIKQKDGAATEPEEQPSGDVTLVIRKGVQDEQEPWEYHPGEALIEFIYEVKKLEPTTMPDFANPLFDCLRYLERVFGLEDELWRPL